MIDLHCHILPGVDDGAASLEESLSMARLAVDSGVRAIAATPHCDPESGFDNYRSRELAQRFLRLEQAVQREKLPLRIHAGMEVFVTPSTPRLLREGQLLTLGGSRYLLAEFDFQCGAPFAERMLSALRQEGVRPVVAHPERYRFVQRDPERLFRWLEEGYVLQLNKGSFFGRFGEGAARTAHWCLREGCIHLIGSDAHSPYQRTTRLSDIHEYISGAASQRLADLLLKDNPGRILADQPVVSPEPMFDGFSRF